MKKARELFLVSLLILPPCAQAQTFVTAEDTSPERGGMSYTLLAEREYAEGRRFLDQRNQPSEIEEEDVDVHSASEHDAAWRSSHYSGRISYTRYEDDTELTEGSCVYSQNSFTYSCE